MSVVLFEEIHLCDLDPDPKQYFTSDIPNPYSKPDP
jgi:hypothetical protein